MKYAVVAGLLALSTAAAAAPKPEPDDLPGPQPEGVKNLPKIDLPAVPAFDLPATEPGFHTPRELRVHGKPVLGTEIKVKGYITWIYDCAVAVAAANPKATRAQIEVAIATNPTLCERPKFYLGDAKTTSRDSSAWVVDVPRLPNKQERERLPKDELKAWPVVPKLALGDYVVVTGTWAIQSPHAEHNTDGLLIYKALAPAQPAAPGAAVAPAAAAPPEPEVTVTTKIPLRRPVDEKVRNASVDHLNACNKAIAARQYDAGIAECQAATKAWPENHLAWYAWASAHMAKGEWAAARDAVQHSVALRPDQGMYQLYHGISLYEAEQQQAREEQARKENKKPDEVAVNPAALKLDPARDALLRAIKLAPDLWRAHYYLGRLYRDRDDAKHAAEQFAATIKTHPSYRFGYIALIELYRKWDYIDEALAVALVGTTNVAASDASELWFEVGMAYDARHTDDKAIDAFSKAIAGKPDDASSKFQRGQIYFRKGDFASAKADLEAVVASPDPRIASAKPVARQILAQIATKH
ncbi:MAG TPA: tetratricopeptide repeat protein [Kofleriaceae bacterium]|nr:tetratricopeptide repeat protein [Kofleriaceae bacterium]